MITKLDDVINKIKIRNTYYHKRVIKRRPFLLAHHVGGVPQRLQELRQESEPGGEALGELEHVKGIVL